MNDSAYKIKLEIFEGPLDLLLYLIKRDELDIHSVSIETITNQYLHYINTFKLLNVDLASEFIVMAANLMYLKSRTLLPKEVRQEDVEEEEDADPRWDLIRQLIEYKKFKDAASLMSLKASEQEDIFAYQPDQSELEMSTQEPPALAEVSIFDLIHSFQTVLKRFESNHDFGNIIDDRFTVADKIEHLIAHCSPGKAYAFKDLFHDATTKAEVIVTFLAVLELMKLNQFILHQDQLLGEIMIERQHYNQLNKADFSDD